VSDPLLSLSGLGHSFGRRAALAGVSFALNRGERVAILGPSGCGKTTLLRLIAGLIPVQEGQITLQGAAPKPGKGSAVIFQSPRLLPWRRVGENISIVLADLPAAARAARVADLLARMGLAERGEDWPDDLSGGQRQRLALARALAMKAPLLLLDEPFANLDPLAREQMQDVVLEQAAEEGSALIAVTHSVDEALILGDRILLMQAQPGRIGQEFTPGLPGQGSDRRKAAGFYPTLATISDALRAAAAA
jgi:NitT/TauT family transport system ATP-binding protein